MSGGGPDALVVGAGPNGLAAAITVARAGLGVEVREAEATLGGGLRSAELTLPGYVHDVCSAIHPLGAGSPCFARWPLADHGLEWMHAPAPLAHPLDGEPAVVLERSLAGTAEGLGGDGGAWRALFEPVVERWGVVAGELLGPPRPPRHPLFALRFAATALRSARTVADLRFRGRRARALFGGLAAHSLLALEEPPTAGVALVLGAAAHAVGWPFPRGGAQALADALVAYLRRIGGTVTGSRPVESLLDLPPARAILADVSPEGLARIAEGRLPSGYRQRLLRVRRGPGVFKLDFALSAPIPWRDPRCARAATVHLGGDFEEIADAERAVRRGAHAPRPFVLLAQPSLFDRARAPAERHTAWAYAHVPRGTEADAGEAIAAQIERFAPGFRDVVLARSAWGPRDFERHDRNLVGGDISGGLPDLGQMLARPMLRLDPYATPARGVYLCSSSTPPGPGVHGLCGSFAARSALRREFGFSRRDLRDL